LNDIGVIDDALVGEEVAFHARSSQYLTTWDSGSSSLSFFGSTVAPGQSPARASIQWSINSTTVPVPIPNDNSWLLAYIFNGALWDRPVQGIFDHKQDGLEVTIPGLTSGSVSVAGTTCPPGLPTAGHAVQYDNCWLLTPSSGTSFTGNAELCIDIDLA